MRLNRANERRGIILMVVLSLLTLFAIVGISFVLYADAQAASARIAREGETQQRPDMDPEECLAMFLGQLIYDVPDTTGYGSGLRGHSLARTMYGYNSTTTNISTNNITPFNGTGRLHTNGTTWPYMNPYSIDDHQLVNYTWFQGDGFARDPEWYGNRQTSPGAAKGAGTYYVGANAPYTYPDLNNFFLAAVRSDGTVLTPSFHRPWLFGSLASSNPNWTNAQGKYLTLRPRPKSSSGGEHPNFPYPDDANGDVKNLVGAPGGNDSIWIDIQAPVMTAPDGTKYKMLVAPLIMDLDNRINVGMAGNILGGGTASRSNQGWFSSEINLGMLWSGSTNTTEWVNLFTGNGTSYYGKYGKDKVPSSPLFSPGSATHVYAQTDLDGRNEQANGAATGAVTLPTTSVYNATTNPNPSFPTFPQGYGSGSNQERANHPAGYAVYKSPFYIGPPIATALNDDLVFRPSDMEALLRPYSLTQTDTGSSALISNLPRLCPNSLGAAANTRQRLNWITTVSSDLARPGLSPWIYNPSNAAYALSATAPSLPPVGNALPFPAFAQRSNALPAGSDFTANWSALDATQVLGSMLGRIDLNRPLPPFPHMASGSTAALVAPNARYDSGANGAMQANVQTQFQLAMQARQQLALDIYTRLLAVTGVAPPSNSAAPTAADLAPRRWLAQLAANIVDYIDADEISTPFNFYNPTNAPYGLPTSPVANYQVAASTTAVTPTTDTVPQNGTTYAPYSAAGGSPDVPAYWVFGTELPRIVINEVLGEYTLPTDNASPPTAKDGPFTVNLWVELFNPLPAPNTVSNIATANTGSATGLQPLDSAPVPLYMPASGSAPVYNPYQLVIANNGEVTPPNPALLSYSNGLWYNTTGVNNNVLGTPQQLRYSFNPTAAASTGTPAICNFLTGTGTVGTVAAPSKLTYSISAPTGGLPGQSFMLVGPSATDVNNDITATAPGGTPLLISNNMSYQVTYKAPPTDQWWITTPPPPGSAAPGSMQVNDNINGISVLLRRLANPHLPPNPFTAAGTLTYPNLPPNPYITVDYVGGVPLNGYGLNNATRPVPISTFKTVPLNNSPASTATPPGPGSYGKLQPYAANLTLTGPATANPKPVDPTSSQYALQTTATTGTVNPAMTNHHTLGSANAPLASPFTWLVHLDRKLISPMELLHVSGFHPHELTQRFILGPNAVTNNPLILQPYSYTPAANVPAKSSYFQHYVPWFDQTRRLYRLFEMVDTHDGASGISPVNGRIPGKININTLWDPPSTYPQIYQAIADPPSAGNADNPNFTAANVTALFNSLLVGNSNNPPYGRTPGLAQSPPVLSANDRPFVGMAASFAPPGGDPQYPNGMGINHTLFTDGQLDANAAATNVRLLQLQNTAANNPQIAHPYLQNELLTKIYNRLTTRSNVFAVFLTVGFFQVTTNPVTGAIVTVDGQPNSPPQLGPEIGRSEGRQIRHRMFAIVDRTNLSLFSTPLTSNTQIQPPTAGSTTTATISVPMSGTNANTSAPWSIQVGTQLVIEPGTANEETVTVTAVTANSFTANFLLKHPNSTVTGNPSSTYAIIQRGNPGPWIRYDPRLDPGVVLYYSIID